VAAGRIIKSPNIFSCAINRNYALSFSFSFLGIIINSYMVKRTTALNFFKKLPVHRMIGSPYFIVTADRNISHGKTGGKPTPVL